MKTTLKLQASHHMAKNQWSRESTTQIEKYGSAEEVLFAKRLLFEDLFFYFLVFFLKSLKRRKYFLEF